MTLAAFEVPRSVYVHVPFCVHRCGYCDFTLVAGRDDLQDAYLDALLREIERRLSVSDEDRVVAWTSSPCSSAGNAHGLEVHATNERRPLRESTPTEIDSPLDAASDGACFRGAKADIRPQVDTVFFGGGTPTQLTAPRLERLLALIHEHFDWVPGGEFSVEANPVGLTEDKLKVLKAAGINRLSLGVQSFDAQVLATLERDHRDTDIVECLNLCRQYFDNIAIDLIFAVPGQSLALWEETLHRAIAFEPQHLSTYGLTFEKGTTFWSRRSKGQLEQADNDLELAMYEAAIDRLAAAGFRQYEISNFAKADFESRHNQVYWAGRPYWGFGPGAASYLNGVRWLNHRSTTKWIERVQGGHSTVFESEELEPEHRARELLVLGLRTAAGIDRSTFRDVTGFDLDALVKADLQRLCRRGLLNDDGRRVTLTRAGLCLADEVAGDLL